MSPRGRHQCNTVETMKTAYEIALERLGESGIEAPDESALSDETRTAMAEVRRKAEAALAELEILHRDTIRKAEDPGALQEAEEQYRRERLRIEERRDSDIAKLRADSA